MTDATNCTPWVAASPLVPWVPCTCGSLAATGLPASGLSAGLQTHPALWCQALAGWLLRHQTADTFKKTHTRQCRDAGKNPRLSRSLHAHEVQAGSNWAPYSRGVELGVATPPAPDWRRAAARVRRGQAPTGRGEGVQGRGGGGAEVGEGVSEVGGARCESGGACVSAHVDARVAAVRACATHTEGVELSARRARPAQRLWIDVQGA